MAVKQRTKRSKPHNNGNNSSAKSQSNDATNSSTDSTEIKSETNSNNLFHNPFFVAGFLTVVVLLCIVVYLTQIKKPSRIVIVTNVNEDGNWQKRELRVEEEQEYQHSIDKIDRRSGLSLEDYRKVYDGKWPVLITDVIPNMKAMNWSKKFFMDKYGSERITIKGVQGKLENAGETLAMPFHLFLSHLHEGQPELWSYLQDELFLLQRPELMQDLDDILYLEDDYYQLFPKEIRPWNAMLLWGTKYSRSFLHIDPYNWTGTNAVFSGLKKWKLYPPGQDHLLYVKEAARAGFPLDCYKYNSPVDAFEPDLKRFPKFAKAEAIEFDQHPGELLMIPTGWFHQAYNGEETMAVSSQVMNINNYKIVLEEIFKAGNLDRKSLPSNFDSLSPEKQVKSVIKHLPKHILQKGKDVTEDALRQIRGAV